MGPRTGDCCSAAGSALVHVVHDHAAQLALSDRVQRQRVGADATTRISDSAVLGRNQQRAAAGKGHRGLDLRRLEVGDELVVVIEVEDHEFAGVAVDKRPRLLEDVLQRCTVQPVTRPDAGAVGRP